MTDVVIEKKGHVAIVKIEHMKAMNALSTDMYAQLEEAFDELAKDLDNVYAVVLTGSSTVNKKGRTVNSFVAGADISEMATKTCEEGKLFGNESNRVCWKIENFKRPVIAAINGFCLGGGCELAMSCDIRLASENATFGQPEVGLGITPGCGGTQRLARLVGAGKAKEMLYTARGNYSAQDALDMGLVNYVYPLENLLDEAVKLAEEIAAQAPIAVSLVKEAVNVGHADRPELCSEVRGQCLCTVLRYRGPEVRHGLLPRQEPRQAGQGIQEQVISLVYIRMGGASPLPFCIDFREITIKEPMSE